MAQQKQVFDEKGVENLWALQAKMAHMLLEVKYDDDLGIYWLKYMGGIKVANAGDKIPAYALALAVANDGQWVKIGVGN